jgi:predicted small metal-binding protein
MVDETNINAAWAKMYHKCMTIHNDLVDTIKSRQENK